MPPTYEQALREEEEEQEQERVEEVLGHLASDLSPNRLQAIASPAFDSRTHALRTETAASRRGWGGGNWGPDGMAPLLLAAHRPMGEWPGAAGSGGTGGTGVVGTSPVTLAQTLMTSAFLARQRQAVHTPQGMVAAGAAGSTGSPSLSSLAGSLPLVELMGLIEGWPHVFLPSPPDLHQASGVADWLSSTLCTLALEEQRQGLAASKQRVPLLVARLKCLNRLDDLLSEESRFKTVVADEEDYGGALALARALRSGQGAAAQPGGGEGREGEDKKAAGARATSTAAAATTGTETATRTTRAATAATGAGAGAGAEAGTRTSKGGGAEQPCGGG